MLCSWQTTLPGVVSIEFRQFHARPTFSIDTTMPGEVPQPPTAKLGQYYLAGLYSGYTNVGKTVYIEPANEHGTFEVLNGVVNYIGDWLLTPQSAQATVKFATVSRELKKFPWLQSYQLFVCLPGREPFSLSWGQLRDSAGS